jgi:astacin (peptidase family M12A)
MATVNERQFCMCPQPDAVSAKTKKAYAGRRAALVNEFYWGVQPIIKVKFIGGSTGLKKRVRDQAAGWTDPGIAGVTFNWVPKTQKADVRIDFQQGNGSWSYLGTYCHSIPASDPTMNYGWLTDASSDDEVRRVVLHEFGHALGLIHEHQNPKGPIKWNRDAVIKDLSGPPNNWSKATIDTNMFDKYDVSKVTATPVDNQSIMMYPIPARWTLDGFSSGLNSKLSPSDRALIHQAYP